MRVAVMIDENFKALYSKLFMDLDNILSNRHDLSLCKYGLISDEDILSYLSSKLLDAYQLIIAVRDSGNNLRNIASLPLAVVAKSNVFVARSSLKILPILHTINQLNNDELHPPLRIFEDTDTVYSIMSGLYQILEELGLFLYHRRAQEIRLISRLYPTAEPTISTMAHSIAVLQSASSRKIAIDIRDGHTKMPIRGKVLKADEGFTKNPIIEAKDRTERERIQKLRDSINKAAIMGAHRAAYVLACCAMLCASQTFCGQVKAEHRFEEIYSITESLLAISMLLSEHVPIRLRRIVSGVVCDKSFVMRQNLLDIIGPQLQSDEQEADIAPPFIDIPGGNIMFRALRSIITTAHNALFTAAYTYETHAAGRLTHKAQWNIHEKFRYSFVLFNLSEATFRTHHVLHVLERNLKLVLEYYGLSKELVGNLGGAAHIFRTTAIISHDAVYHAKSAQRTLGVALSLLMKNGGEDFIKKFSDTRESYSRYGHLDREGVSTCTKMHDIAQHMRSACLDLLKVRKHAYLLKLHGTTSIIEHTYDACFSCVRVFDALLENFHDYAYVGKGILPGELPKKCTQQEEHIYGKSPRIPLERILCALDLTPFEKLRNGGKQPASNTQISLLSTVSGVVRRGMNIPSSMLSHMNLESMLWGVNRCALSVPLFGRVGTVITCSQVQQAIYDKPWVLDRAFRCIQHQTTSR